MLTIILLNLTLIVAFIVCFVTFVYITRARRPISNILAWLFFIFLIPYIGIPLFLLVGQRKFFWILRKKRQFVIEKTKDCAVNTSVDELLNSYGALPPTEHNLLTLLPDGVIAYQAVLEQIKNAQDSIFISTYILANDVVGCQIVQLLTEKARQGVRVCLLIDTFGNLFMFPRRKFKPFIEAGGFMRHMMPLIHLPLHGHANLRDHRKMMIFDGKIGIVGGMNLANHYMGPTEDPARWIDVAMLIRGNGVQELLSIFESDWKFANLKTFTKTYQAPVFTQCEPGNAVLQMLASGPDTVGDQLYDAILMAIFAAKNTIYIVTPYFIIDEIFQKAFTLAARRGVQVNIILPRHSNHPISDLVRSITVRKLHASGAKIWFCEKMIHAKVMTFDDTIAVVGSANLDLRSLLLNFEISCFIYSQNEIAIVQSWVNNLTSQCTNTMEKPTLLRVWAEDLAQIIKPLL